MNINQSNQNKKTIYFFMPTIEGGGIEKNLLILSDFFCKKNFDVYLFYSNINKNIEQKLNKKIIKRKSKKYFFFSCFNKRIWDSLNCSIDLFFYINNQKNVLFFHYKVVFFQ